MSDFSGGNVTTGVVRTEAMKEVIKELGGGNNAKVEDVNKKLLNAAKEGDLSSALKCIQDGATAKFKDKIYGQTVIHYSAALGHSEFITGFLDLYDVDVISKVDVKHKNHRVG